MKKINTYILILLTVCTLSTNLSAQEAIEPVQVISQDEVNLVLPAPTQMGLMEPASSRMERIVDFHDNLLMWIITAIVIFVMILLAWVAIRYNQKSNPTPSKTTHNVLIEVLWTAIPVLILIIIAIPSFKMLYYLERVEDPEMTVKVTGYQWYWGYEYVDHDNINFLSYMIPEDEIDPDKNQVRLLSTDNPVVLPINTNIRFIVTAADVLHSFTVPPFGFKKDAVPGRLNETWVNIDKPGIYFGQCSEICGINHAYMPIEIHAVTKEEFEEWLVFAKEEFAYNAQTAPIKYAMNTALNNTVIEGVR